MPDDPLEEGEEAGEPGGWRDPVRCPVCASEFTRLVEMRHERGFYECEACGATFEEEG